MCIVCVCVSEKCDVAADNTANKRSLRAERRVQLATSASKTSSPLPAKHSQRSLITGASSSPSTGRPTRAKVVDLDTGEKSGGASSDDGSCVSTEPEKSKDWTHITQRELHGLRDLVGFLEGLDTDDRRAPSEIQLSADELLSSAKVTSQLLNVALTWPVFVCDLTSHASSCSSEACFQTDTLLCLFYFTFTFIAYSSRIVRLCVGGFFAL